MGKLIVFLIVFFVGMFTININSKDSENSNKAYWWFLKSNKLVCGNSLEVSISNGWKSLSIGTFYKDINIKSSDCDLIVENLEQHVLLTREFVCNKQIINLENNWSFKDGKFVDSNGNFYYSNECTIDVSFPYIVKNRYSL